MDAEDIFVYLEFVPAFFEPLINASEDQEAAKDFLQGLGYLTPEEVTAFEQLMPALMGLDETLIRIDSLLDDDEPADYTSIFVELVEGVGNVIRTIDPLVNSVFTEFNDAGLPTDGITAQTLSRELFDYLFIDVCDREYPHIHAVLNLIGIFYTEYVEETTDLKVPYLKREVRWDNIPELFQDPGKVVRETYWPDSAEMRYNEFIAAVQNVALAVGLLADYDTPDADAVASFNDGNDLSDYEELDNLDILRFPFMPFVDANVGCQIYPVVDVFNAITTAAGLGFYFGGEQEIQITDRCKVLWDASAVIQDGLGLILNQDGEIEFRHRVFSSDLSGALNSTDGYFKVSWLCYTEADDEFLLELGTPQGTRFEINRWQINFGAEIRSESNYFIEIALAAILYFQVGEEADSFVQQTFPSESVAIPLEFTLGVSALNGFYLKGGTGLEGTIPINLLVAGILQLDTVYLGLRADNAAVQAVAAVTGGVQPGPLLAKVENVGVQVVLTFPEDNSGNLGPMDVDFGFKPPNGVALSLDASGVVGGGYLFFDAESEQYAGIIQLQFEQLALTAIGLLTTRMPDGTDGFSLIIMLAVEDFTPIELGLGFKLTGIGGLLGINRTVAVNVLRSGLKNQTLDRVLFPSDPIKNATTIISTLRSVFPPTPDQYIFGPIAEISWGKEGLLTAKVALILEFPNPVRLILLGQMRALFPNKTKPLVRLNLDVLGIIDFDKGEAFVLATLFDSQLVQWSVTGDAAFLVRWKGNPVFILSAGGFHPGFSAPPDLPKLERLAMVLSQGSNLQLRMTWYLALTSNTLQHGSRVDLHVSASKFSVDGHLSYDVLVQFDPFSFVILFSMGVALKWGRHTLASVQLEGALSGPSPWHVKGKAKFKILFFSKSIRFEKTLGQEDALPPLPVVDPLPLLTAALSDPVNWSATLPEGDEMLVSLRDERVADGVKVHPLGEIAVRQQVLPLNEDISRFGNAKTAGPHIYRITAVTLNGETLTSETSERIQSTVEFFAPGQFSDLTQAERLSRPSFERMQAGVRVSAEGDDFTYDRPRNDPEHEYVCSTELAYETKLFAVGDVEGRKLANYLLPEDDLEAQAAFGAAGQSPMKKSGVNRFDGPSGAQVQVNELEYVVASRQDLSVVTTEASPMGIAQAAGTAPVSGSGLQAAIALMKTYEATHPELANQLQVIPRYESKELVTR